MIDTLALAVAAGCVTRAEYAQVQRYDTPTRVVRLFGAWHGPVVREVRGSRYGIASRDVAYPSCSGRQTIIRYRYTTVDGWRAVGGRGPKATRVRGLDT